jgi:hypothetical protein
VQSNYHRAPYGIVWLSIQAVEAQAPWTPAIIGLASSSALKSALLSGGGGREDIVPSR